MTVADRSQLENDQRTYGQAQNRGYGQSYAAAGREPQGGDLWSPERYRAALAAR